MIPVVVMVGLLGVAGAAVIAAWVALDRVEARVAKNDVARLAAQQAVSRGVEFGAEGLVREVERAAERWRDLDARPPRARWLLESGELLDRTVGLLSIEWLRTGPLEGAGDGGSDAPWSATTDGVGQVFGSARRAAREVATSRTGADRTGAEAFGQATVRALAGTTTIDGNGEAGALAAIIVPLASPDAGGLGSQDPGTIVAVCDLARLAERIGGERAGRMTLGSSPGPSAGGERVGEPTERDARDVEVRGLRWKCEYGVSDSLSAEGLSAEGLSARIALARATIAGLAVLALALALAFQRDRRRARASASALAARRDEEDLFRTVFDTAPIGLIAVDGEGEITLTNDRAEALFGYSRAELIGQPVELLVPIGVRERHSALRRAFLRQPQNERMAAGRDVVGTRRDGSDIALELALRPVDTTAGMLVLVAIADVTARRESDEELRVAYEELLRFNRVAAGREERMIELKRQVNALSQELGRPPPYRLAWLRSSDQVEPAARGVER